MKCSQCKVTKLISATSYFNRKKTTIGNFCPRCLQFQTFDEEFDKKRIKLIIKQKLYAKPKFSKLKKQRRACPYCMENGIINHLVWNIRL